MWNMGVGDSDKGEIIDNQRNKEQKEGLAQSGDGKVL